MAGLSSIRPCSRARRVGSIRLGASLSLLAALAAGCAPDWDALDPSLASPEDCVPENDDKECTNDVCQDGVVVHPIKTPGTACTEGVCSPAGECVQCNVAADCAGVDTECRQRRCDAEACGFSDVPEGTPTETQVVGDCSVAECNGTGTVINFADDTDVPVDGIECTGDVCALGIPSNPPLAIETPCTENGGIRCDGAGSCVECNQDVHCGVSTACVQPSCDRGSCIEDPNLAAGTSCGVDSLCDGLGVCFDCLPTAALAVSSTDPPAVIPNGNGSVSMAVEVVGLAGDVLDADVHVSIAHDSAADLTIELIAPDSTVLPLSVRRGGNLANVFLDATFDDDAALPARRVTETVFTGVSPLLAIPERSLGLLDGVPANGTWTLRVSDASVAGIAGMLQSWSLSLTAQPLNPRLIVPEFASADTPIAVPDAAEVTSEIVVADVPGPIAEVTVEVDVTHPASGQLTLELVSPAGKTLPLSRNNGAQVDDVFAGTIFDERAPLLIGCVGAGCVTFGGSLVAAIPEQALTALVGDDANGTWTLRVADDANGNAGMLEGWTLRIVPALCPMTP
jgi:subtilisin-like proprotein convertase family protein